MVVAFYFSNVKNSDVSLSGNANDIVDRVLRKFQRERIDPLPIKVNTENIRITHGLIRGLSNIRRCGDCTFIADDWNTKIHLQLEVSGISSNINYEVRAGLIWLKGKIGAVAKRVAVKLEVSLVEDKIRLNSFEVVTLDDYRITQLTGVSPVFNWMLKFLINGMIHTLKDRLLKTLEKEIKVSLQDLINKLPLSKL